MQMRPFVLVVGAAWTSSAPGTSCGPTTASSSNLTRRSAASNTRPRLAQGSSASSATVRFRITRGLHRSLIFSPFFPPQRRASVFFSAFLLLFTLPLASLGASKGMALIHMEARKGWTAPGGWVSYVASPGGDGAEAAAEASAPPVRH